MEIHLIIIYFFKLISLHFFNKNSKLPKPKNVNETTIFSKIDDTSILLQMRSLARIYSLKNKKPENLNKNIPRKHPFPNDF